MQTYLHIFFKMQNTDWNKVAKRGPNAFITFSIYAIKMQPKVTGEPGFVWGMKEAVFSLCGSKKWLLTNNGL